LTKGVADGGSKRLGATASLPLKSGGISSGVIKGFPLGDSFHTWNARNHGVKPSSGQWFYSEKPDYRKYYEERENLSVDSLLWLLLGIS
jgi:hypothetical protein